MAASYTAKDILVLEGLEPFGGVPACTSAASTRPGSIHLLWEIVDNSVDEAMNGYATASRRAAQGRRFDDR